MGAATHFAPAARASAEVLEGQVAALSNNPLVDALLGAASGLLAVLNEQRQVLAVNEALLESFGVENAGQVLGLRPGQVVRCVHAEEAPNGCGTTQFCSSCGAAIAMVASLTEGAPAERLCALSAERDGSPLDMCLAVRAAPVVLSGERVLLLFLQDVTRQQERAALEQVFFHDVRNLITALAGWVEMLTICAPEDAPELAGEAGRVLHAICQELTVQQKLLRSHESRTAVSKKAVTVAQVLGDLEAKCAPQAAGLELTLSIAAPSANVILETDPALARRVLVNMVRNAFEASGPGDAVKAWAEVSEPSVAFCVWNRAAIPAETAGRVFQRHFSTKPGEGRGLGAYSMKLVGEELLGGQVGFTTSEEAGTTFRFVLPRG